MPTTESIERGHTSPAMASRAREERLLKMGLPPLAGDLARAARYGLTSPEVDALRSAACGDTVKDSARLQFKSPETIKSHRGTASLKLGARNTTQAVSLAILYGLLRDKNPETPGRPAPA